MKNKKRLKHRFTAMIDNLTKNIKSKKKQQSWFAEPKKEIDDKEILMKMKQYFENNYAKQRIYQTDIELAMRKFNIKYTSIAWKIESELNRFVSFHNQDIDLKIISCAGKTETDKKENYEEWIFNASGQSYNTGKPTWKDMRFCNGYIEVDDYKSKRTYKLDIQNSREQFNEVKMYFMVNYESVFFEIKEEKVIIVGDINLNNLLAEMLLHRLSSFVPDITAMPRYKKKYLYLMNNKDIRNYVSKLKSIFIEYLCNIQLNNFRIQYTPESRISYSQDNWAEEDDFIFTIKNNYRHIVVVVENTLDARSSIVFFIHNKKYKAGIKAICAFLKSSKPNKREFIAQNQLTFEESSGILGVSRIYHTQFKEWKREIQRLLR